MTVVMVEIGACPSCGEPWSACTCGRATPPGALDTFEPEPPPEPSPLDFEPPRGTPALPPKGPSATELAARAREQAPPLVEWVQWMSKRGELSRYHVRLHTGGALLCGRRSPPTAAADSFPPPEQRCVVCRLKLRELA